MSNQLVAIILAAGDSSRMGSPKALLRVGKKTFLQLIIEAYAAAGIPRTIILGRDSSSIKERLALSRETVLVNTDPSRGPLSSLLIGLERVRHSDAIFLHPVDHPLVLHNTIRSLAQIHKRLPSAILIPEFRGRRGHPVLIPSKYYPELRQAPLSEGARWVVRENRAANHLVSVCDPGILKNIDTRQDYTRLFGYPRLDCP
jgi:CTP:molybdopterin cytidylyltransferase MocA